MMRSCKCTPSWILIVLFCFWTRGALAANCDQNESQDFDILEEWYGDVKTFHEIEEKIDCWAENTDYESFVEVSYLKLPNGDDAKTVGGHNIPLIRIGNNIGPHGKPALLILGGAHARECGEAIWEPCTL
jgi:hypothetical protein